ncbi:MAG: dihydrodipicolinate synthase family protein [Sporichthyaceae bacterium]
MVLRLAIPALTFRDAVGGVDEAATFAYAERAAATWLTAFVLNGTTTEGSTFTPAERAQVLDLWLAAAGPERLLACCWTPGDVLSASIREVRALVVMRDLQSREEALTLFARLPEGAYVYSHPLHTRTVLDPALIAAAREAGVLPLGAKITKAADIPALRAAAGENFDLWDGSSRRIAASLAEGASGVISTPLAAVPDPFPAPDDALQRVVDGWQAHLDEVPDEAERAAWLRKVSPR